MEPLFEESNVITVDRLQGVRGLPHHILTKYAD